MRKTRIAMFVMALALVLALALTIVGCGSKKKSGDNGGTLTGANIVAQSTTAMQQVKGATVGFDLTANVSIDETKVNAQTKAMVKDPITVKGTLKFNGTAVSDSKVDLTATAKAGAQSYDVGAKIDGSKGWLGLMGQWYILPMDTLSQIGGSPTPSASSAPGGVAAQLKTLLGVDDSGWITSNDLVGTEQLDGKDVYHISNKLDIAALATSLSSLAQSSSLLGGASTLPTTAKDTAATIKELQSALKEVKIDTWYEKDTFYLKKLIITAKMDLNSDPDLAAQGLNTLDLTITITMGDYNADFSVTPPATALPLDQLTNSLGSLTGGTGN